jgi:hypothetical protein
MERRKKEWVIGLIEILRRKERFSPFAGAQGQASATSVNAASTD